MDKVFPKLYEQSSTGKVKHWLISVFEDGAKAVITVCYGAGDDKVRISTKDITKGKNLGRSNETTPFEQAASAAEATWKKKLDKGYVEDIKAINDEVLLPMLAHSFQKRGHNISYPCFVQPKLDGIRCLAKKVDDSTIKYYSRMGKEFNTLEHLTPELLACMQVNQVFDGEIYSHNHTFQEMIRLVKKLRPESIQLEFWVFDLVDVSMDNQARQSAIEVSIPDKGMIRAVKAKTATTSDMVDLLHNKNIERGFEGLILRNLTGMYKLKGRSPDLQKYKHFEDDEFKIIGGQESTGTEAGAVLFHVKTKDGLEFTVRPRGSVALRKKWMLDLDNIVGKELTVRYQELTDDGIPRFPVGISIRDYEG